MRTHGCRSSIERKKAGVGIWNPLRFQEDLLYMGANTDFRKGSNFKGLSGCVWWESAFVAKQDDTRYRKDVMALSLSSLYISFAFTWGHQPLDSTFSSCCCFLATVLLLSAMLFYASLMLLEARVFEWVEGRWNEMKIDEIIRDSIIWI